MKAKLQDHHAFGGGSALPKGAMGNNVATSPSAIRREPKPIVIAEHPGDLSPEDGAMFDDICASLKHKQADLGRINEGNVRTKKEGYFREQERLRLKNGIADDLKDLRKILDCAASLS